MRIELITLCELDSRKIVTTSNDAPRSSLLSKLGLLPPGTPVKFSPGQHQTNEANISLNNLFQSANYYQINAFRRLTKCARRFNLIFS